MDEPMQHGQQFTRKRGERRNPLTNDQRDQTLLRVEVSAQRVRLEELAVKFQEFAEESGQERKALVARLADVEGLVEEQRRAIERLRSLVPLGESGGFYWGHGELSSLSPHGTSLISVVLLDITAAMMRTPDLESWRFSPVVTFENGTRALKRSNTLPDGHWGQRQGALGEADGTRNSQNWSRFINGTSPTATDRRGGEPADSPVVREGSEATLVSSPSPSDSALRIVREARSDEVGRGGMMEAGEDVPDHKRMEQWTPNMEEILARLRTFEGGSPIGR